MVPSRDPESHGRLRAQPHGRLRAQPHGRYAYDGLERIIHERARLGILTSLATHGDGLRFNDLKDLCSLTDGNLSRHLQVLQEAGLVSVRRLGGGGRPQTTCRLTAPGRRRFLAYLAELEQVVGDALGRQGDEPEEDEEDGLSEGLSPA